MSMETIIVAEQFSLTPALKRKIEETITEVEVAAPDTAGRIRVFLSKEAQGEFKALLHLHVRGRELVVQESGPDLYLAVHRAGMNLRRSITRKRRRAIEKRRIRDAG